MLGKIGAAVGIAFGVALINFGKQSVKLASDLQEVQNVVDVAFGDMTYKMEEVRKHLPLKHMVYQRLTAKNTGSIIYGNGCWNGYGKRCRQVICLCNLTALSADMVLIL